VLGWATDVAARRLDVGRIHPGDQLPNIPFDSGGFTSTGSVAPAVPDGAVTPSLFLTPREQRFSPVWERTVGKPIDLDGGAHQCRHQPKRSDRLRQQLTALVKTGRELLNRELALLS